MFKNIETKVIAAAASAGFGGALGTFLTWLLGVVLWGAPANADAAVKASAAVPTPVSALLVVILAVLGAWLGGYAAPHTDRPDLATSSATYNTTVVNTPPAPVAPQPADAATQAAASVETPTV